MTTSNVSSANIGFSASMTWKQQSAFSSSASWIAFSIISGVRSMPNTSWPSFASRIEKNPHAYGEWMRVLKTGGVLLNFDANYGKDDASDAKDLPEQHAHFKVGNEMLEECERIKAQLPISRKNRPAYDVAVLCENTEGEIRIDTSLGKRIYLEKDEFYNPAPMFSICAVKQ